MKDSFILAVFHVLLLSGCVHTVYEIQLTPQGDSIDRTLTVSVENRSEPPQNTSPSDEIIERLDSVYADHERQTEEGPIHQPPLPLLVYAAWVEPNEGNQRNAFGGTKLDGDKLKNYVIRYEAMTVEERLKWDGLIARLNPGTESAVFQAEFDEAYAEPPAIPSLLRDMISDAMKTDT